MKPGSHKTRGFTLLELMAAMVIGLIVVGSAVELFKSGMDATALVTQQAEMQQNVRSALNLVARDVSMAGSGLPVGGVSLPFGTGSVPSQFGCDLTATCYLTSHTYFTGMVGASTITNHMYGLLPGPNNGIKAGSWTGTVPATGATADSVTSVYVDYSFPLDQYSVVFGVGGTSITVTPPAAAPIGFPAIISPTGINIGDLILVSNTNGFVVGEVTGLTPLGAGVVTINFADSDPLNINQSGAASGKIASIMGASVAPTAARRLWAISYYIDIPTTASRQTPRLMRQVSGFAPQPVADNIIGLRLTYDTCDNTVTGVTCAALPDPVASGFSLSNIHKANIQVIGQSVLAHGNKSRSMALVTSVSTRSLNFKSGY
jgi:prepilin-type N-terminal cleavage/methylation domain-containing protein